jgi:hypothetical protein
MKLCLLLFPIKQVKHSHKQSIRVFIMEVLHDENIRHRLLVWEDFEKDKGLDLDSFEAIEFYEKEVERINKMFFYPELRNA